MAEIESAVIFSLSPIEANFSIFAIGSPPKKFPIKEPIPATADPVPKSDNADPSEDIPVAASFKFAVASCLIGFIIDNDVLENSEIPFAVFSNESPSLSTDFAIIYTAAAATNAGTVIAANIPNETASAPILPAAIYNKGDRIANCIRGTIISGNIFAMLMNASDASFIAYAIPTNAKLTPNKINTPRPTTGFPRAASPTANPVKPTPAATPKSATAPSPIAPTVIAAKPTPAKIMTNEPLATEPVPIFSSPSAKPVIEDFKDFPSICSKSLAPKNPGIIAINPMEAGIRLNAPNNTFTLPISFRPDARLVRKSFTPVPLLTSFVAFAALPTPSPAADASGSFGPMKSEAAPFPVNLPNIFFPISLTMSNGALTISMIFPNPPLPKNNNASTPTPAPMPFAHDMPPSLVSENSSDTCLLNQLNPLPMVSTTSFTGWNDIAHFDVPIAAHFIVSAKALNGYNINFTAPATTLSNGIKIPTIGVINGSNISPAMTVIDSNRFFIFVIKPCIFCC